MADNRKKKTTEKTLVPRSTKAEIEKICQTGVTIITERNYTITKKDFKSELNKRYENNISPDRLNSYCEKIVKRVKETKQDFRFLTRETASTKKKRYAAELPLKHMGRFINEVIIIQSGKVIPVLKADPKYFIQNNFISNLEGIQKIFEESDTDVYPVLKIYYNHSEYKGFETVICDIYERQFIHLSDFIVSTSAHTHCSAIEFRSNYLEALLEFTYRLFKNYWIDQRKKNKTKS